LLVVSKRAAILLKHRISDGVQVCPLFIETKYNWWRESVPPIK
jgi:hypothetical protein